MRELLFLGYPVPRTGRPYVALPSLGAITDWMDAWVLVARNRASKVHTDLKCPAALHTVES